MEPAETPQISILMATYEPRLDWLKEQLISLNSQNYPNLKLYIRDDSSRTTSLEAIRSLIKECITKIPFELKQNETNLGSNTTFEMLTREADGSYFAYCDQDDVWMPEKLSILKDELDRNKAKLVCSDMHVIDENGKLIADSISKVHRRIKLQSGEGLAERLLFHNFVAGCTILIRAEDAKAAVPFCPYYVHDQYLAIWCAEKGWITSLTRPLICYRIHSSNQTEQLSGVYDKKSYEEMRIRLPLQRLQWLNENMTMNRQLQITVKEGILWANARIQNWNRMGGRSTVWQFRKFSLIPSVFELVFNWLPEGIFKIFIAIGKRI